MRAYLDWNATTPPLPEVLDAMREAAGKAWANPSSIHGHGRAARAVIEDARASIAALAGVDPRDVVFTSGGTEANNLALRSAFAQPGTLVTSRLEHPSVTRVAEALEREGRARVRWLGVLPSGTIDLDDLARALDDGAALVTVQALNHAAEELATTARALRAVAGEDSATATRLNEMLEQTAAAARALRVLAEAIETQPESLISGRRDGGRVE